MLLGLKSTLEEVELNVMAQRLHAAKWAAAQRGELRSPLPVGFVHDDAGEVVIDPDAEVLAAIGDPFAAFAAFGPTYRVVAALAGWRFPLRAYGGVWAGQLRWGALTPESWECSRTSSLMGRCTPGRSGGPESNGRC